MRWILILLLAAVCVWAYSNINLSAIGNKTDQTIRQETILKKYFKEDEANKHEFQKALDY